MAPQQGHRSKRAAGPYSSPTVSKLSYCASSLPAPPQPLRLASMLLACTITDAGEDAVPEQQIGESASCDEPPLLARTSNVLPSRSAHSSHTPAPFNSASSTSGCKKKTACRKNNKNDNQKKNT